MMELKDTVTMMNSEDYKERFKAEYYQTKIRYEKLKAFNTKIEAAHYNTTEAKVEMPKHDCPDELLHTQQALMGQYLHILEVRAVIEGIDLTSFGEEKSTMQQAYEEYFKQSNPDYSGVTFINKEYDSTITCSNKVL